jgi:hypothetical protein
LIGSHQARLSRYHSTVARIPASKLVTGAQPSARAFAVSS